jgi:hypothetical protein
MNMRFHRRIWQLGILAVSYLLTASASTDSLAQQRRYEPSRPTVSPYLQLFRDDNRRNNAVPNYYTFVRPMLQQYQVNQAQQRLLLQQSQEIGRLQTNVQALEQQQAQGLLIAPTGKGSWFNRPSTRSSYLNTSRYYSKSGPVGTPR